MTYDPRRDDLLFQSAKADGKGWFELPNMRDLAPRGWPPAPPEPMVRKPATPDPRDALIAELYHGLEDLIYAYRKLVASGYDRITELGGQCDSVETMDAYDPWLNKARAALRRARGLA